MLAFNRDGTALASGGTDGTVRLWQVPPGRSPWSWQLSWSSTRMAEVRALAFSPGQPWTLATGHEDGALRVWDFGPLMRQVEQ